MMYNLSRIRKLQGAPGAVHWEFVNSEDVFSEVAISSLPYNGLAHNILQAVIILPSVARARVVFSPMLRVA